MSKRAFKACQLLVLTLVGLSAYTAINFSSPSPKNVDYDEKYLEAWNRYRTACEKNEPRLYPIPFETLVEDRIAQEPVRAKKIKLLKKTEASPTSSGLSNHGTLSCYNKNYSELNRECREVPSSALPRMNFCPYYWFRPVLQTRNRAVVKARTVRQNSERVNLPENIRWTASFAYSYTGACQAQHMNWAVQLLKQGHRPADLDQRFDTPSYCCTVPQTVSRTR